MKKKCGWLLKNIPEAPPVGFPLQAVLTVFGRLTLVWTLLPLSSVVIGIRDDRLFWTLLPESFCRCTFLSASSTDEEPLSVSLLSWGTLTGILDFCCSGGRRFWSLFSWGWSHKAIAFHSRFSLKWSLFCVSVLRVFAFFWFGFCTFLSNQIVKRSKIPKAPNLDTDRTDSWSKWFCFERKSMETISDEFSVIQPEETFDRSCTGSFGGLWEKSYN